MRSYSGEGSFITFQNAAELSIENFSNIFVEARKVTRNDLFQIETSDFTDEEDKYFKKRMRTTN